ncbi:MULTISPECIES: LysR family transcriptional regulator [Halomonadaceae]|uniref:LysR family transcriptional regulator n=1 Tax=Vreelandella alkaliphila TaxID=272774 RepID=A0AAJ2RTN3_9GAMM|nr:MULTISPECIES: LysR family transcriptional regulator [Halomonas]MCD6006284.1 LysR family transcriptional regulator [Halomonas sp. IOP_6]MDX5977316.1 LysR family transcriptional regulator [Halomonas alkaliphila]
MRMEKAYSRSGSKLGGFNNLRRLAYFSAVVETGSFTAAAERLGITKAVVSQQVARLEQEFRTSLLTRTTRSVQVTSAGKVFYQRCALILREAEDAFDELGEIAQEPTGTLRLTAPFDYGVTFVVPAIAAYTQQYPDCRVDATLRDQKVDLMAEDIELAIRVGWLTEASVQARKIGSFQQLLVASPSLEKEVAQLSQPEELLKFPFIANKALPHPLQWEFSLSKGERRTIHVRASIFLDATLAVREALYAGAGISVLPDYVIAGDIAAGRLIHILPQWSLPSGGIHVVFPLARFRPAKVRAFVDILAHREQQRQEGAFIK